MTEQTEQLDTEIKTIKIGEKAYAVDSMTEYGRNILQDLQKVDGVLNQQQLLVSVTQLAKGKLLEELTKEAANFTEVEDPTEATPVNDTAEADDPA